MLTVHPRRASRRHRDDRPARAALAGVAVLLGSGLAACGSESPGPEPELTIRALTGQSTEIRLAQGFTAALGELGLTPSSVGSAEVGGGRLSFPITGGNLTIFAEGEADPYVIGQVQHNGSGLRLRGGGTNVRLLDLTIDPGASRVYGTVRVKRKTVAKDAYLFFADGRKLAEPEVSGSVAFLRGTRIKVSPDAASLLNDTFGTDAVEPGLLVGTAVLTVAVPPGQR